MSEKIGTPKHLYEEETLDWVPRNLEKWFFLHKEIPFGWIAQLVKLPKSAIVVGLALVFRRVLLKESQVTLPKGYLLKLGVSADQKRRGLRELRKAGLVEYEVEPGKSPKIKTLFEL